MIYRNRVIVVAACALAVVTSAHAQAADTTVHGGQILADIVGWGEAAFGVAIASVATAGVYKFLQWMGIQVTDGQKSQLQAIAVNGLNAAAARAQVNLRGNATMDINVQNDVIKDAVRYTQEHAADTIKALGLDPESGQAVEAIRARIATAIVDPSTPTNPAVTPAAVAAR